MRAKFVNESLLEARKVDLVQVKPGNAVIVTKPVSNKDLNYRKTAKSWMGRNIYPYLKEWGEDIELEPGMLVYLSVDPTHGYKMGTSNSSISSDRFLKMMPELYDMTEEEFYNQFLTLLISGGYAEEIPWNQVDESTRIEFENTLKRYRIWSQYSLYDNEVVLDGSEVIVNGQSIMNDKAVKYQVYDKSTNRELQPIIIKNSEMNNHVFEVNGEEISSDPFDTRHDYK